MSAAGGGPAAGAGGGEAAIIGALAGGGSGGGGSFAAAASEGRGLNFGCDLGSGFGLHGSHRDGLERVPFDGYRAELHAGEKVLAAAEAKEYRQQRISRLAVAAQTSGRGGGAGNVTVQYIHHGNVVANDPMDHQRQQQQMAARSTPRLARGEIERKIALAAVQGRKRL